MADTELILTGIGDSVEPAPYGYELIIDLHQCDTARFNVTDVERFCKELCALVKMKCEDFHIWASESEDYATAPSHLYGTSAVQFITTSTLVIHTLPKLLRAYINLFSCKPFDEKQAQEFVATFFGGTVARSTFIERI